MRTMIAPDRGTPLLADICSPNIYFLLVARSFQVLEIQSLVSSNRGRALAGYLRKLDDVLEG